MKQDISDLQIHIHKVDGATTIFVQTDASEARRWLDSFEPTQIFNRERFVATDGNSITALPTSKITRLDLISERLPNLVLPLGGVEAVELMEAEFKALIRNPVMREQWKQITTQEDSLVAFMELEMADGQCVFLTTEMHVELQSEELWKKNWFPLDGSSLCFRMRAGGVAVLNLANLIRLRFFPKPILPLADAWHVHEFHPPSTPMLVASHSEPPFAGNPPLVSISAQPNRARPQLKTQ